MAIMEWLTFLQTICYMGCNFSLYLGFNVWVAVSQMMIVASCGFIAVPVITEEMIKICSIIAPERIVFATGLFQTGSQITTAILGSCMTKFWGNNDRELKLCGGIIMTFIFVLSLICISYFEHYLRKSPFYEQVETLRREDMVVNSLNKKEVSFIKEICSAKKSQKMTE